MYTLDPIEQKALVKFRKKHSKKCSVVSFTETGIGTRIIVYCMYCSKSKDISNYESW